MIDDDAEFLERTKRLQIERRFRSFDATAMIVPCSFMRARASHHVPPKTFEATRRQQQTRYKHHKQTNTSSNRHLLVAIYHIYRHGTTIKQNKQHVTTRWTINNIC